jgi:hypothetical protein
MRRVKTIAKSAILLVFILALATFCLWVYWPIAVFFLALFAGLTLWHGCKNWRDVIDGMQQFFDGY